jgi:IS4 transposase
VALVGETLHELVVPAPQNLIGDRGFDSSKLAIELQANGIELIAPKRSNNQRRHQDGRRLRRAKRRWKVERLFAWLKQFRRIVVRWENKALNYLGFLCLGCLVILLRRR